MTLPPLPSLERRHIRTDSVASSGFGSLEALLPINDPYVCPNQNAPAMLLVPGLGLDGLGLIRQLPLGSLSHLHLFQMPNHPAAGESGLASFARYVEEYIRAKKLDEHPGGLILGGNSMGGAVSLLVASRGRVKLKALVLIGTYGSCRQLPAYQRFFAPLAYVVPMRVLRKFSWALRGNARLLTATPEEGRWMGSPFIRRTFGYYGRAVGALTRMELLDGAKNLSLPTLVVHGTHDPVLRPAAAEELARTIPNAKMKWIDGARHSLFFTHAEPVNAAVAEFVRQIQ